MSRVACLVCRDMLEGDCVWKKGTFDVWEQAATMFGATGTHPNGLRGKESDRRRTIVDALRNLGKDRRILGRRVAAMREPGWNARSIMDASSLINPARVNIVPLAGY